MTDDTQTMIADFQQRLANAQGLVNTSTSASNEAKANVVALTKVMELLTGLQKDGMGIYKGSETDDQTSLKVAETQEKLREAQATFDQINGVNTGNQNNITALNGVMSFLTSLQPNGYGIFKIESDPLPASQSVVDVPPQNGTVPRSPAPGRR